MTDPQRRIQASLQRESISRQFYLGGPARSGQVDVSQAIPHWLRLGLIQNYRRVTSPLISLLSLDPDHLGQAAERVKVAELLHVTAYERMGRYIDLAEAAWIAAAEDQAASPLLADTMEKIRQNYRQIASPSHLQGNERLVEEALVRLSWYDRTYNHDAPRSRAMIEEIERTWPEFSRQWQPLVLERARVYYGLGDVDPCRRTLEQLIAEHGKVRKLEFGCWAQAHMMLGYLALDAGDRQQAIAHWRRGQFAAWSSIGPEGASPLPQHPPIPQVNHVCGPHRNRIDPSPAMRYASLSSIKRFASLLKTATEDHTIPPRVDLEPSSLRLLHAGPI